ncbi:uncharacterized protein LOC144455599 [Phascolarctos cinereus]
MMQGCDAPKWTKKRLTKEITMKQQRSLPGLLILHIDLSPNTRNRIDQAKLENVRRDAEDLVEKPRKEPVLRSILLDPAQQWIDLAAETPCLPSKRVTPPYARKGFIVQTSRKTGKKTQTTIAKWL